MTPGLPSHLNPNPARAFYYMERMLFRVDLQYILFSAIGEMHEHGQTSQGGGSRVKV